MNRTPEQIRGAKALVEQVVRLACYAMEINPDRLRAGVREPRYALARTVIAKTCRDLGCSYPDMARGFGQGRCHSGFVDAFQRYDKTAVVEVGFRPGTVLAGELVEMLKERAKGGKMR